MSGVAASARPPPSIDTRFSAPPALCRVPLYPLRAQFEVGTFLATDSRHAITVLTDRLAEHFSASPKACMLGSNARTVLAHFLTWLAFARRSAITVALPSFYCPETALHILGTGAQLVLLEIDWRFSLSTASKDTLERKKPDVLIWPDIFAVQKASSDLLSFLQHAGMIVIRDRAHTFPLDMLDTEFLPTASLVSFGHSKFLAGSGGGALILHQPRVLDEFGGYWNALWPTGKRSNSNALARPKLRALLQAGASARGARSALRGPWASDKRSQLEKVLARTTGTGSDIGMGISWFDAATALQHWRRCKKSLACHIENQQHLMQIVERSLGKDSVHHLNSATCIAALAIRVPSHIRYLLSRNLAKMGLQTTWYYYPLHLLSRFKPFARGDFPVTELLAGQVLILPLHWSHTERRVVVDISALGRALSVPRD